MYLHSVRIKLFCVAITFIQCCQAIADTTTQDNRSLPTQSGSDALEAAKSGSRHEASLRRLKAALEDGAFLVKESLSCENVARVFGESYSVVPSTNPDGISFLDANYYAVPSVYFDASGTKPPGTKTPLWWNMPTFRGGGISRNEAGSPSRTFVSIVLSTTARTGPPDTVGPELVEKVFGLPTSLVPEFPPSPPLHGARYVPEPQTHPLGNKWMIYEFNTGKVNGTIRFRTLGDGAVSDIQARYFVVK